MFKLNALMFILDDEVVWLNSRDRKPCLLLAMAPLCPAVGPNRSSRAVAEIGSTGAAMSAAATLVDVSWTPAIWKS